MRRRCDYYGVTTIDDQRTKKKMKARKHYGDDATSTHTLERALLTLLLLCCDNCHSVSPPRNLSFSFPSLFWGFSPVSLHTSRQPWCLAPETTTGNPAELHHGPLEFQTPTASEGRFARASQGQSCTTTIGPVRDTNSKRRQVRPQSMTLGQSASGWLWLEFKNCVGV